MVTGGARGCREFWWSVSEYAESFVCEGDVWAVRAERDLAERTLLTFVAMELPIVCVIYLVRSNTKRTCTFIGPNSSERNDSRSSILQSDSEVSGTNNFVKR